MYLDYIVAFIRTFKDTLMNLRVVFKRMGAAKLKLKLKK